jgi:cobalt-precorrin-5B (C1)-methyltransferase
MAMDVPPHDRKGLRTGFTTGACASAAAKAATRCLVRGILLSEIETTLPNRMRVTFSLARCERVEDRAICSVIKDAGDDPDCTHGAELTAEVELRTEPGIAIKGGSGVATVTKTGLGLKIGGPAINPVPRRNIAEMVGEELADSPYAGAVVTISVPGGEEMAKKTTNARLGLLGGISILGTTGIVRPYSTAAFKASVMQEIDVAAAGGLCELVLTTGGKSEQYAMALYPRLPEQAFIQVGDFIGVAIKQGAKRGIARAVIVGMMGKLSKMANGKMMTHAAGSEVDMEFLASLASELEAPDRLVASIRQANTARHVLELCREAGLVGITSLICKKVVEHCEAHAGGKLTVETALVDFGGALLGRYPEVDE